MSRLGEPSLRGEIHLLGMNYEFHNLLPIKVLVCGPSNMAVLRSATCQRPGIRLSRAPERVPGRPVRSRASSRGRAASLSALHRRHDSAGPGHTARGILFFPFCSLGFTLVKACWSKGSGSVFHPSKVAIWKANRIKLVCRFKKYSYV